MNTPERPNREILDRERWEALHQIEDWLETPMIVLGFVWLALLVIELIWRQVPGLETAATVIWIIFIFDFAMRFLLAPRKGAYLKSNWLTLISLALPALRIFRAARIFWVLRASRSVRGLRLLRLVTSFNRGARALRASLGRRRFGYVVALTVIVIFTGAAGMLAFENEVRAPNGIHSYGEALWWTAMLVTTIASEYWPQTPEGRLLCFLLSLYSLGILSYLTAALATFFIDRDAANEQAELPNAQSIRELHAELVALREEMRRLNGGGR